jgi:hypothetical protein
LRPIFRIEEDGGNIFLPNVRNVLPECTAPHSIFKVAEDGVIMFLRNFVMERFKGANFNIMANSVYVYELYSFL